MLKKKYFTQKLFIGQNFCIYTFVLSLPVYDMDIVSLHWICKKMHHFKIDSFETRLVVNRQKKPKMCAIKKLKLLFDA